MHSHGCRQTNIFWIHRNMNAINYAHICMNAYACKHTTTVWTLHKFANACLQTPDHTEVETVAWYSTVVVHMAVQWHVDLPIYCSTHSKPLRHAPAHTGRSVYLVTNLNWRCYSCPMGLPPVSSVSSFSSSSVFQTLLPHLLSFTHPIRVSILAELRRPFSLCLSAGDPEFSSNMTSQHGLSLFSPSLVSLSSPSSFPLPVLLQLVFVLLHIK